MSSRYFLEKTTVANQRMNPSNSPPVVYSLDELRKATNDFSKRNELGKGGFGVVYKGSLNGSEVAIKRLDKDKHGFINEAPIPLPVHPNLLRLLGIYLGPEEKLLVFPYMENGSLASCLKRRLNSKPLLDWDTRKRIAHGSAIGVVRLHNSEIIHRDIKAENILLNKNFEAVVADFDLVRLLDTGRTHVTTYACGTPGLIAPECVLNSTCSYKADVYAYGLLLLEIITGDRITKIKPGTENSGSVTRFDWIKGQREKRRVKTLVDSDLRESYSLEEADFLVGVALRCIESFEKDRPKMTEVVQMLGPLVQVPATRALSLMQPVGGDSGGYGTGISGGQSNTSAISTLANGTIQNDPTSVAAGVASSSQTMKSSNSIPHRFPLDELKKATNNFSEENVIRKSLCGVLYRGRLTDDSEVMILFNTDVKVHSIKEKNIPKHPNLLPLLGFCIAPKKRLLVSPYMVNGSLADCLEGSKLNWNRRKVIAHGTAMALAYLHERCIVHEDIKPENILLNEEFKAVVAGFRYDAPRASVNAENVKSLRDLEKTDIYAYGTLIFVIIAGNKYLRLVQGIENNPRAVAVTIRHELQREVKSFLDPKLQGEYNCREANGLIRVAMQCIQDKSEKRPKMSKVVKMLDDLVQPTVY